MAILRNLFLVCFAPFVAGYSFVCALLYPIVINTEIGNWFTEILAANSIVIVIFLLAEINYTKKRNITELLLTMIFIVTGILISTITFLNSLI